jgi:diphosphomevalonate decarboxylase
MKNSNELSAPSNIALIKYWGKTKGQYPVNANVSFTLKNAKTFLQYSYVKNSQEKILLETFKFNEKEDLDFKNSLEKKLERLNNNYKFPFGVTLSLQTHNTFPHSSGIASSASSMATIAKMLGEIYEIKDQNVLSSFARELSGSAARSIQDGWNLWGVTDFVVGSSQDFAININQRINPDYLTLQDWIFICSSEKKSLSSSDGHKLMDHHKFLNSRIQNAQSRMQEMLKLIETTPHEHFFELCEQEALELHAMMMTSEPPYILMEPESLYLMKKITNLRRQGVMCGYTLDAGSSVHLLFPKDQIGLIKRYFEEGYFGKKGTHFIDVLFDECEA